MSLPNTSITKFYTQNIDEKKIESDGKYIYSSNTFFHSLGNLMEHPEFQHVFKEHFNSWEDIKLFVMFLKVYEKIGDQFPNFNGYQKLALVKSLIGTSSSRRLICDEIINTYNISTNKWTQSRLDNKTKPKINNIISRDNTDSSK
jgi:hypothetical protein